MTSSNSNVPQWYKTLNAGLITEVAKKYDINPDLIAALIMTESAGDPWAVRYEPNWKYHYRVDYYAKLNNITSDTEAMFQATSFGLMQIMGTCCRELCWDEPLTKLTIPKVNIMYGCKKIKQLFYKYPLLDDVISAYNQGSPRKSDDGTYRNQAYVDKVKRRYNQLKGIYV